MLLIMLVICFRKIVVFVLKFLRIFFLSGLRVFMVDLLFFESGGDSILGLILGL